MTEHTWAEREALRYAKLQAEIIAQIRDETGEIVEAGDEAVLAELEGLTQTVDLVNYLAERVKRQEAEAVGLKAQADAYALPLYDKAAKLETKASNNRKRLLNILEMVGASKLGRIGKKVAGNKPIHFLVDEKDLPGKLPAEFWTQPDTPKPQPSKSAIAKALRHPETAKKLEGVAVFGNGTPTLTID